jgi:FkbM family methyltransferase
MLFMENLLNVRDFAAMNRTKLEGAIRSRTQIVYLGENMALCRILGRHKFFVDTRDIGFASHLMLDGFWEMWLTQFMARHLKPGMKVVDVGANFGYYSLLMSELISNTGYCVCIEPNPAVAEKLAASLSINGFAPRSKVANCAAGDGSESSVRFYIPHREPKNARIISAGHAVDERIGDVVEVPCKSVDEICAEIDHIDFVKIDAEGGEEAVFRGMKTLIARDRPDMILEFNYLRYSDPDQFIAEITSYYPDLQYLDFNSEIQKLSIDRLPSEQLGEDWLFFLSSRG